MFDWLRKKNGPSISGTWGLALGAGGTRGSYQVGVWQYLREREVPIGGIAGTSIGSLNGALIAQGDFDRLRDTWLHIDAYDFLDTIPETEDPDLEKRATGAHDLLALTRLVIENRGLDLEPLRQLLSGILDEERVRASGLPYILTTVDVSNLKPRYFSLEDIPRGQLIDYILASCSVPIFRPAQIDGIRYLDGALYDRIPVVPLADRGFRQVMAVDLTGQGIHRNPRDPDLRIMHIKNSEHLGKTFQFDTGTVRRNIRLGYLDTKRCHGELAGCHYYLRPPVDPLPAPYGDLTPDEEQHLGRLLRLPADRLARGSLAIANLRKTVRRFSGTKGPRQGFSYMPAALEIAASQLEVDRLREYTVAELGEAIVAAYRRLRQEYPPSETAGLPHFFTEAVRTRDLRDLRLNRFLPEIVDRGEFYRENNLFGLMALSVPRYSITLLLLHILQRRQAL